MSDEIAKATQQAQVLEKALKRATTDKGISYYSLTAELNKAGTSAAKLTATLARGGQQFAASLSTANAALALADRSVISLNSKIKEMARVTTQSFKFTAAQTFLLAVSNAARDAYRWVEELNKTVTDISVVTGYQGDQLDKVTQNAIAGAKELRIAANDYAEGALIFYQQGLGDDEVARRVEITAKAARAASSSLEDMSSQLTAIWNTYKMTGDEMERAASVGAKMAGDTAVDFADIAEAMQTAAAPAEQMGVSYNSLAAIIATVGDTTQQSASVIGNAFKTIFSRFQQLKSEGTDGEVTLNRVSSQLQELGVNVLDSSGQLRQLDDVITEVGNAWDGWSSKQQLAIAQLVGGTRQYGQFLTLMNNFSKYQELLQSANLEDGSTLEQQYQSSLQSIESYAENAEETWRRAFGSLIDEDAVKTVYKALETIGKTTETFLNTLGGIPGILMLIGARFSKNIVPAIARATQNAKEFATNLTHEGRVNNINRDYARMNRGVNAELSASPNMLKEDRESLELQKQKNEFNRKVALINEEINTQLKTASGEYKVALKYQQSLLKSAQELYDVSMNQVLAIQQQAEAEQRVFEEQEARKQSLMESTGGNLADAALTDYTVADDNLTQAKANLTDAQKSGDLEKIKAAQREVARATAERAVAQENLNKAIAQEKAFKQGNIYKNITSETLKLTTALGKMNTTTGKESEKAFKQAKESARGVVKELQSIVTSSGQSNPALTALADKISKIPNIKRVSDIDAFKTAINEMISEFGAAEGQIADFPEPFRKALQLLNQINDKINVTGQAGERMGRSNNGVNADISGDIPDLEPEEEDKRKIDYQAMATGFAQVASSAAMAATMVSNFWNTMEDESASAGEKFLSFLMMVGMLIPTIQSLNSGIVLLAKGFGLIEMTAQGATVATVAQAAASKIAELAAKKMWAAILGPIALVVAGILGVVAVLKLLGNEDSLQKQIEANRKELESLNSAVEDCKNKLDELTSSIDEYNGLVDVLRNCTTGSEEWAEALQDVNNKVLELLQLFPQLAPYISRDEQGVLTIDKEGIEEAQRLQEQLSMGTQIAQTETRKESYQLKQESSKQEYIDMAKAIASEVDQGSYEGYYGGTRMFAESSVQFEARDIFEKFFDESINEIGSAISYEEIAQRLQKYYEEAGYTIVDNYESVQWNDINNTPDYEGDDIWGKSGEKYIAIESLNYAAEDIFNRLTASAKGYVNATQDLENTTVALDKSMASIIIAGENFSEETISGAERMYNKAVDEISKEEIYSLDRDALVELFGEKQGVDVSTAEWDDEGNIELAGVSFTEETLRNTLIGLEAIGATKNNLIELDSLIGELSSSTYFAAKALGDFAGNNLLDNSTLGQISWLEKSLENAGEGATSIKFGDFTVDSSNVSQFGYETIEEFVAALEQAIDNAKNDFDNITEGLTANIKGAFDRVMKDKSLSVNGQRAVAELIQTAFDTKGMTGQRFMENFLKGMSSRDLEKAAQILNTIDWSSIAPEDLVQKFNDAGISVEGLSDAFPTLISWLNETEKTIDQMTESYNNFTSIAKDVQENGIISAEQYQMLKDANLNVDSFVTRLRDGTYLIMGDAQEFYNYLMQAANVDFNNIFNQTEGQYNAQMRVSDYQQAWENTPLRGRSEQNFFDDYLSVSAKSGASTDGTQLQMQLDYLKAINQELDEETQRALEGGYATQEQYDQIAEKIRTTKDEYRGFNDLIAKTEEELNKLKQSEILSDAKLMGLDPEAVKETAAQIQDLSQQLDDAGESTTDFSEELNETEMLEIAKDLHQFGKGVEDVNENYDSWLQTLEDVKKAKKKGEIISDDDVDNIESMTQALSDMLGISANDLPDSFEFTSETLGLMKDAANGSGEAMAQLEQQVRDAQLEDWDLVITPELEDGAIQGELDWLKSYLDSQEFQDIDIGVGLDAGEYSELYTALNEIINATATTADEATRQLERLGFDAEVVPVEAEQTEHNQVVGYTYEPVEQDIAGGITFSGEGSGLIGGLLGGAAGSFSITQSGSIMGVEAIPKTEDVPTQKETKGAALAIKPGSLSKAVGGNVKVANGKKITPSSEPTKTSSDSPSGGSKSTPKFSRKSASKTHARENRYEDIGQKIEENTRQIEKLSDAADDAFGIAKLRNLQKINKELQEQGRLLGQLREEAKRYLPQDQTALENAYQEIWTLNENVPKLNLAAFEYNDEGFVTNFEEVTQPLWDQYIAAEKAYYDLVNQYNDAGAGNEELEQRIEEAKEYADQVKSIYDFVTAAKDQVNDTAKEAADALNDAVENIRTWMANKLDEAAWKMELQVNISETDIELMDYYIDKWGDLGVKTGKTLGFLNNSMGSTMDMLTSTIQHSERLWEIMDNIDPQNPNKGWFEGEFTSEAWNEYIQGNYGDPAELMEALQDDADSMIGFLNDIYDTAEEMLGQYIEVLELYMDDFDKIADRISYNNDRLEMFKELMEFSGKQYTSAGREAMKDLADATVDNAATEVRRASAALEVAQKAADDTQGQLEDFLNKHGSDSSNYSTAEAFMYNQLKAAADEAYDTLQSTQGDFTSAISDLTSAASEAIEQMAEIIKQEVVENLGGDFADFSSMTEMYDNQYDLDTFFLEDYDKNYQLGTLLRQIDEQMESITDPARLEEYKALMDEINAANQEGVDITQTDVDLLNAKFEIQKAQDAYEEAQNAKNTMRLARDASGNWSYVYSQDESSSEDPAQALADAQYNYEKLLHDARDEASQYWLQAQQDFFEFQESIDQARYETDEKYRNEIDLKYQYYAEKTQLYSEKIIQYNDLLGDNFSDTTLGVVTNYDTMESAQADYTAQHEYYHTELENNTKDYQKVVEDVCEEVGINYGDLEKTVSDETYKMEQENNDLKGNIDNLRQEAISDLTNINNFLGPWREQFCTQMELAEQSVLKLISALQQLQNWSLQSANTGFNANRDYTATGYNLLNKYGIDPNDAEAVKEFFTTNKEGILAAAEWANKVNSDLMADAGHSYAQGGEHYKGPVNQEDFINAMIGANIDSDKHYDEGDTSDASNKVGDQGSELEKLLAQFGISLGNGGLLKTPNIHQIAENGPEIVLNPEDTRNILEAVKRMRETVRMKMSSMNSSIDKKTDNNAQNAVINKDIQQVDQTVTIDASFPNVSVASEIEEAFNNLINQAVQYAGKKR